MFADNTTLKLGDVTVKVKRLTIAEIRAERALFGGGGANLDETYDKIVREHVTLEDGSPVKTEDLSMRQLQTLVKELVGIPEGSGISDFIGLLC